MRAPLRYGLFPGIFLCLSGLLRAASPPEGAAAGWPALSPGREAAQVKEPVCITHAGDGSGRLFLGERAGRVMVLERGRPGLILFLDLAGRISAPDGGLRGLAFPFDFVDKRYLIVSYVGREKDLVVSRFRLAPAGGADPGSEQVLLKVPLPGKERPGGGLAFGLDGKLYVGVGEGVPAGKSRGAAQDLGSPLGKILRIEADPLAPGTGPLGDNPFAKRPGARPDLWAVGLGNPAWLGVDSRTGDLYITDSSGERAEEIQVQPGTSVGGENYGWNVAEGEGCRASAPCETAAFTKPAAFLRRPGACEVTGGVVPQAAGAIPPGTALFGDRCSGKILGLRRSEGEVWESRPLSGTGLQIAALGIAEDGKIYVADGKTGRILELMPAPVSSAP